MVKVLKPIICYRPEDLRKLKHNFGIVIPRQLKHQTGKQKTENKGSNDVSKNKTLLA